MHKPVIWQISALHIADNRTLISGVLLNDMPYRYSKSISAVSNLLKLSKSYFTSPSTGVNISITSNRNTLETTTDKNGCFEIITNSLHKGTLEIRISNTLETLQTIQVYPIIQKNSTSKFDIISDIDETLITSYTAHLFKRISTLMFITPYKRKPIYFTQNLLEKFRKHDTRVIYISKSESNLFGMLTTFIEHHKLPQGHLFLTPYLKFRQIFKPKLADYKLNKIRFMLKNTGNKKYILLGDDSQKDIEIYTKIAQEFPESILKIVIRQTKQELLPVHKKLIESLKKIGVSVLCFNDQNDINILNDLNVLI